MPNQIDFNKLIQSTLAPGKFNLTKETDEKKSIDPKRIAHILTSERMRGK